MGMEKTSPHVSVYISRGHPGYKTTMAAIMYPALRAFTTNMTRRKSRWEEAVVLPGFSITNVPFLRSIIPLKEYASPNTPRKQPDAAPPVAALKRTVPGGKALLGLYAPIPTGLNS
jgi:hypothetical protein